MTLVYTVFYVRGVLELTGSRIVLLYKASELSRIMKEWLWELWKVLGNFEAMLGGWVRHINYSVLGTGSHWFVRQDRRLVSQL